MSEMEQVKYFNPLLILVWILQIIIVAMDYSADSAITWSIPVVGSFLLVQIYMIWKTNYDEMVQESMEARNMEQNELVRNTPLITPGKSDLSASNSGGNVISLGLAPSLNED
jgi:hypothetical protein